MNIPTSEELIESTPRLLREDLETLQEWISQQPHLPHMEEFELILLLNVCDYNLELSKKVVDSSLTMRTHAPEIFKFRDPRLPDIRDQLKFFNVAAVGRNASGYTILCGGWSSESLGGFNTETVMFLTISFVEMLMRRNITCPGYILLMDAYNFKAGHLTKFSMSLLKKMVTFFQDAIVLNIVAVHVMRLTPVVDKLMFMIKPFLSKAILEKLHFHTGNLESVCEFIPKDLLPQDYGGNLPSIDYFYGELTQELLDSAEWLQSLDAKVVDESRRPGGPKTDRDVFGILGAGLFK